MQRWRFLALIAAVAVLAASAGLAWASRLPAPAPAPSATRRSIPPSPTPRRAPLPTSTPVPLAALVAQIKSELPPESAERPPLPVAADTVIALSLGLEQLPAGGAAQPALSADGRWAAFTARPGGAPFTQLYLLDREAGEVTLLSAAPSGAAGDGWTEGSSLSADGAVIAFYSWAGNLAPGDANGVRDLYVRDMLAGSTERVSVASDGSQANDRSGSADARPALSADGRYVAYFSAASNLVAGDRNGLDDIFLYDRRRGRTLRLSTAAGGGDPNGPSRHPALSADGRIVVFQSQATNLIAAAGPALPGVDQIYALDRESGAVELVSRSGARDSGAPGNGPSAAPVLSADGRFVAFVSAADNLVPGDGNQAADTFVHDRRTGLTERVSLSSAGVPANRDSSEPAISADGRYVAFTSAASNLVSGDANHAADVFLHDRRTRHTIRLVDGADGPQGAPALAADASLIAFAADAANLVAGDANQAGDVFLYRHAPPPTYMLAGLVIDAAGRPLPDVRVTAGRLSAVTDAAGLYSLPNLLEGAYTLSAVKSGYSFTGPQRVVNVGPGELPAQNFNAVEDDSPPHPFLDLPFAYGGTEDVFLRILRDVGEGGRIVSWFDHDAPTTARNGRVTLWNGRSLARIPYNEELGCFEQRCYDGHNGTDFPYRDLNRTTPIRQSAIDVYAAAGGVVSYVESGCEEGDEHCGADGYGNHVVVSHRNGYFTLYGHLASVAASPGDEVSTGAVLGVMGNSGRSRGIHLHFGVHRDNGNGLWDGWDVDLAVDPFGWNGVAPDPWVAAGGPVSHWLWQHTPVRNAAFLGSQGAALTSAAGDVQVTAPAAAFTGQVRLELAADAAPAEPEPPLRLVGHPFRLHMVEWLAGGAQLQAALALGDINAVALSQPLELTVSFAAANTRHLDTAEMALARWDGAAWAALPTQVASAGELASAESSRLGLFALVAPLLCADDTAEPDDHLLAAAELAPGAPPLARRFDLPDDEDWLRIDAQAGRTYLLRAEDGRSGVAVRLELLDGDGVTPLATALPAGPEAAVELRWQPTRSGDLYLRLTPAEDSAIGCAAAFRVTAELEPDGAE